MDNSLLKKAFIEAYQKSFGNISQSCRAVGISRQTYYNWIEHDRDFDIELKSVEPAELFLDFLESKLIERVNKGDTTATIFALKTKGKSRGYIEKTETDITTNGHSIVVAPIKWLDE
jgi:hypothetical protein